jgi:alpha-beta hydrolase superfamily lysophospholipase
MTVATHHRWFRSGRYLLLGHADLPSNPGGIAVVIVPPFGFEDVCSYGPLRQMAGLLSANGIPTLRYDLPGTGDSSGGPLDSGLVAAWTASVDAAAGELRELSGAARVAVVGVHLGAALALLAAASGAAIQDLILWGPMAAGRHALRELRAYAKMQRSEIASTAPAPEQPVAGLEVAGFLLTPETQQDIEKIDLTALPAMPGRRVLLLSRDDYPPEGKLIHALEAAECPLTVQPGEGYARMMAPPHESSPPAATGRAIVEFLAGQCARLEPPVRSNTVAPGILIDGACESALTIPGDPQLFGIVSEPPPEAPRTDLCVLLLNAGAIRHIGPNRMWVGAARRWAARGVTTVRLDLPGIGESDGERDLDVAKLYRVELVDDVERAMHALAARLGRPRFAVAGLCSGAFWAFHAALRNPEIRAAFLLNPRLFFWDPEVDRRRVLRRTAKGLADARDWRRLLQGRVDRQRFAQVAGAALARIQRWGRAGDAPQIPPGPITQAWAALERHRTRLTMIFSENEPLLSEMEEEGRLPPKRNPLIRCARVPNSDHTFCPLHAQKRVTELMDRELEAALSDGAPAAADDALTTPEIWRHAG